MPMSIQERIRAMSQRIDNVHIPVLNDDDESCADTLSVAASAKPGDDDDDDENNNDDAGIVMTAAGVPKRTSVVDMWRKREVSKQSSSSSTMKAAAVESSKNVVTPKRKMSVLEKWSSAQEKSEAMERMAHREEEEEKKESPQTLTVAEMIASRSRQSNNNSKTNTTTMVKTKNESKMNATIHHPPREEQATTATTVGAPPQPEQQQLSIAEMIAQRAKTAAPGKQQLSIADMIAQRGTTTIKKQQNMGKVQRGLPPNNKTAFVEMPANDDDTDLIIVKEVNHDDDATTTTPASAVSRKNKWNRYNETTALDDEMLSNNYKNKRLSSQAQEVAAEESSLFNEEKRQQQHQSSSLLSSSAGSLHRSSVHRTMTNAGEPAWVKGGSSGSSTTNDDEKPTSRIRRQWSNQTEATTTNAEQTQPKSKPAWAAKSLKPTDHETNNGSAAAAEEVKPVKRWGATLRSPMMPHAHPTLESGTTDSNVNDGTSATAKDDEENKPVVTKRWGATVRSPSPHPPFDPKSHSNANDGTAAITSVVEESKPEVKKHPVKRWGAVRSPLPPPEPKTTDSKPAWAKMSLKSTGVQLAAGEPKPAVRDKEEMPELEQPEAAAPPVETIANPVRKWGSGGSTSTTTRRPSWASSKVSNSTTATSETESDGAAAEDKTPAPKPVRKWAPVRTTPPTTTTTSSASASKPAWANRQLKSAGIPISSPLQTGDTTTPNKPAWANKSLNRVRSPTSGLPPQSPLTVGSPKNLKAVSTALPKEEAVNTALDPEDPTEKDQKDADKASDNNKATQPTKKPGTSFPLSVRTTALSSPVPGESPRSSRDSPKPAWASRASSVKSPTFSKSPVNAFAASSPVTAGSPSTPRPAWATAPLRKTGLRSIINSTSNTNDEPAPLAAPAPADDDEPVTVVTSSVPEENFLPELSPSNAWSNASSEPSTAPSSPDESRLATSEQENTGSPSTLRDSKPSWFKKKLGKSPSTPKEGGESPGTKSAWSTSSAGQRSTSNTPKAEMGETINTETAAAANFPPSLSPSTAWSNSSSAATSPEGNSVVTKEENDGTSREGNSVVTNEEHDSTSPSHVENPSRASTIPSTMKKGSRNRITSPREMVDIIRAGQVNRGSIGTPTEQSLEWPAESETFDDPDSDTASQASVMKKRGRSKSPRSSVGSSSGMRSSRLSDIWAPATQKLDSLQRQSPLVMSKPEKKETIPSTKAEVDQTISASVDEEKEHVDTRKQASTPPLIELAMQYSKATPPRDAAKTNSASAFRVSTPTTTKSPSTLQSTPGSAQRLGARSLSSLDRSELKPIVPQLSTPTLSGQRTLDHAKPTSLPLGPKVLENPRTATPTRLSRRYMLAQNHLNSRPSISTGASSDLESCPSVDTTQKRTTVNSPPNGPLTATDIRVEGGGPKPSVNRKTTISDNGVARLETEAADVKITSQSTKLSRRQPKMELQKRRHRMRRRRESERDDDDQSCVSNASWTSSISTRSQMSSVSAQQELGRRTISTESLEQKHVSPSKRPDAFGSAFRGIAARHRPTTAADHVPEQEPKEESRRAAPSNSFHDVPESKRPQQTSTITTPIISPREKMPQMVQPQPVNASGSSGSGIKPMISPKGAFTPYSVFSTLEVETVPSDGSAPKYIPDALSPKAIANTPKQIAQNRIRRRLEQGQLKSGSQPQTLVAQSTDSWSLFGTARSSSPTSSVASSSASGMSALADRASKILQLRRGRLAEQTNAATRTTAVPVRETETSPFDEDGPMYSRPGTQPEPAPSPARTADRSTTTMNSIDRSTFVNRYKSSDRFMDGMVSPSHQQAALHLPPPRPSAYSFETDASADASSMQQSLTSSVQPSERTTPAVSEDESDAVRYLKPSLSVLSDGSGGALGIHRTFRDESSSSMHAFTAAYKSVSNHDIVRDLTAEVSATFEGSVSALKNIATEFGKLAGSPDASSRPTSTRSSTTRRKFPRRTTTEEEDVAIEVEYIGDLEEGDDDDNGAPSFFKDEEEEFFQKRALERAAFDFDVPPAGQASYESKMY